MPGQASGKGRGASAGATPRATWLLPIIRWSIAILLLRFAYLETGWAATTILSMIFLRFEVEDHIGPWLADWLSEDDE